MVWLRFIHASFHDIDKYKIPLYHFCFNCDPQICISLFSSVSPPVISSVISACLWHTIFDVKSLHQAQYQQNWIIFHGKSSIIYFSLSEISHKVNTSRSCIIFLCHLESVVFKTFKSDPFFIYWCNPCNPCIQPFMSIKSSKDRQTDSQDWTQLVNRNIWCSPERKHKYVLESATRQLSWTFLHAYIQFLKSS